MLAVFKHKQGLLHLVEGHTLLQNYFLIGPAVSGKIFKNSISVHIVKASLALSAICFYKTTWLQSHLGNISELIVQFLKILSICFFSFFWSHFISRIWKDVPRIFTVKLVGFENWLLEDNFKKTWTDGGLRIVPYHNSSYLNALHWSEL